jgi:hypothetical protein
MQKPAKKPVKPGEGGQNNRAEQETEQGRNREIAVATVAFATASER